MIRLELSQKKNIYLYKCKNLKKKIFNKYSLLQKRKTFDEIIFEENKK